MSVLFVAMAAVSLSCVTEKDQLDFVLDEANGRAFYDVKSSGDSVDRKAIFTPTEVKVLTNPAGMFGYILDRQTLKISFFSNLGEKTVEEVGTCKVIKAKGPTKF